MSAERDVEECLTDAHVSLNPLRSDDSTINNSEAVTHSDANADHIDIDNNTNALSQKDSLWRRTLSVWLPGKVKVKTVRIVQYICFVISLGASVYFMSKGYINVALQYFQICFIAAMTVCLDAESAIKQRVFFAICVCVALGWAMAWNWAGYKYLSFTPLNYVCSSLCSLFFLGGLLCMIFVSLRDPLEMKVVELDLLLYLISLNAVCFFAGDESLNNSLHMILDIRMYVLLYSVLYQPKQKLELLNIPSFPAIILITIITFGLYTFPNRTTSAAGNLLYVGIGSLLIREAWLGNIRLAERKKLSEVAV